MLALRRVFSAVLLMLVVVLPAARAQNYSLYTLANFNGSNGAYPNTTLALSADGRTLYGTTYQGGLNDLGTVFALPVTGGAVVSLAAFSSSGGQYPIGSLILSPDGGTLYGTTSAGSDSDGTAFSLPSGGGALSTLTTFTGAAGALPSATLTLSPDGGTLYGTTATGGSKLRGNIFSLPITGGVSKTLASFLGSNGTNPYGPLTLSADGKTLYGTTSIGGTKNDGTVFSLPVGGGTPTMLASLDTSGSVGGYPVPGLTLSADGTTLYGATLLGGASGNGVIFSLPVRGGTPTLLTSFSSAEGPPGAGLALSADGTTLYGTTQGDGSSTMGTVFSAPVGGGALTTLGTFDGSNGAYPDSVPILGADGSLYGTTSGGGPDGYGTVFALTPQSALPPVHSWTATAIAAGPDGKTRILWDKTDGSVTLWTLNADGSPASYSPTFGPLAGWTAKALSVGPDNAAHILWTNTDGRMTLWTVPSDGSTPTYGPYYGPIAGWTATSIATDADNNTHVLWDYADGSMTLWTFPADGSAPTYGPIYGPIAGWTATSIATGFTDAVHVLWDYADGSMTLWTFPADGSAPTYGGIYGPYFGWTASALGVDSSGAAHVLWDNTDGHMTLWTFPADGSAPAYGPTYGPYAGWSALGVSVGAGNDTHVLWDNTDGRITPWTLDTSSQFVGTFPTYGPF